MAIGFKSGLTMNAVVIGAIAALYHYGFQDNDLPEIGLVKPKTTLSGSDHSYLLGPNYVFKNGDAEFIYASGSQKGKIADQTLSPAVGKCFAITKKASYYQDGRIISEGFVVLRDENGRAHQAYTSMNNFSPIPTGQEDQCVGKHSQKAFDAFRNSATTAPVTSAEAENYTHYTAASITVRAAPYPNAQSVGNLPAETCIKAANSLENGWTKAIFHTASGAQTYYVQSDKIKRVPTTTAGRGKKPATPFVCPN